MSMAMQGTLPKRSFTLRNQSSPSSRQEAADDNGAATSTRSDAAVQARSGLLTSAMISVGAR